ncbi:DUF302 domain-containing protein [Tropicimonas isoalkanivorans]|uniref:Uncharacterized conserved protein, DUF302 family n=1 Tax=Tropicimonas isoalkanivorans TaxID=441112 RepID=A0A1I1D8F8_9RHOB|nr:DUF302 domain-containing protein [Tropicimonas isoalkanivorans]SFB71221.1 Uncharacterized conserved protein, DUF302 family [Tropicimonas isoalkanivorans]
MAYTIDRQIDSADMEEVERRTRDALSTHGFGVLTEIDLAAKLKEKLGADLEDYKILGACHPPSALEAVKGEPRIGALLPCNVILRKVGDGIEVSAIDPVVAFEPVDKEDVRPVAEKVRKMLEEALADI